MGFNPFTQFKGQRSLILQNITINDYVISPISTSLYLISQGNEITFAYK